jgi:MFS family permease
MLRVVRRLGSRLGNSAAAVAAVFRNASLRWLELSWTFWILGHWAYLIAVSVYAYNEDGEKAVGILFLLRLVPAAIVSPFAGLLADRLRREQVLIFANLGRISLVGGAAAGVILGAPSYVVYALAIVDAIVATPVRSAQAALTPALARDPAELTAANAVARGVESFAVFGGPALAGLLLAVTTTGAVFLVTAAMLAVSVLFVTLIRAPERVRPKSEVEAGTIVSEALAGFRAIGRDASLRVMMGLFTAETAIAGALQVYIVLVALETLDLGDGGVGFLNSAMGVGALIGAVSALSLAGVRRLSPAFLVGLLLRGLPLVAVGLVTDSLIPVLLLLGVFGLGGAFVDVPGLTIVQRSVPEDVLARVFGVIQMLWLSSIGIGAALAPVLVGWLGLDGALVATGLLLPLLVVLFGLKLVRIDAEAEPPQADELRILASIPIFTPLPGLSLEHLAGRLVPLRHERGTVIVQQGEAGDRFFIVAEGDVEVSEDGRVISELGTGDYFGEISLIRDVPRTATVTAKTPVVLYALDRDDFLAAVTSHAPSAEAAEEVVSSRLAGIPVAGARLPAG